MAGNGEFKDTEGQAGGVGLLDRPGSQAEPDVPMHENLFTMMEYCLGGNPFSYEGFDLMPEPLINHGIILIETSGCSDVHKQMALEVLNQIPGSGFAAKYPATAGRAEALVEMLNHEMGLETDPNGPKKPVDDKNDIGT